MDPLYILISLAPVALLIVLLGVMGMKGWMATVLTAAVTIGLALCFCREALPVAQIPHVVWDGIAFALHPICLVILAALFVYSLTVASGAMTTIRTGLANVSEDPRVLALLIVFGFGNFMEGMAGFGTAVAIPAAILVGIGFDPFKAVVMCLVANTVPTAYGSVGVPLTLLAKEGGVDLPALAWTAAWLQLLVMAAVPILVLLVYGGFRALRGMGTLLMIVEGAFLVPWLLAARFVGWELPDILGGISTMLAIIAFATRGKAPADWRQQLFAWIPFGCVVIVLGVAAFLPPAVKKYASPGALILMAGFVGGAIQRLPLKRMCSVLGRTFWTYRMAFVTVCAVLVLAKVMGAAGMIATLAKALVVATGQAYPFFAPVVGALGGFVTGSGTSTCVLFGALQSGVAREIGASPLILCAANVMGAGIGKMVCPQSIAIGVAAAGLAGVESRVLKAAAPWFLGVLFAACLACGLSVQWSA